jgi:hypothetical protein
LVGATILIIGTAAGDCLTTIHIGAIRITATAGTVIITTIMIRAGAIGDTIITTDAAVSTIIMLWITTESTVTTATKVTVTAAA